MPAYRDWYREVGQQEVFVAPGSRETRQEFCLKLALMRHCPTLRGRRVGTPIDEGYLFFAVGAKNHFEAVSSVFKKFNSCVDTLIRPTGSDGCVPSTYKS